MLELNKVLLVGNLTRDPVFRSTGQGRSVADMTIAVSRRVGFDRESGERQEETVFIDVTVWEKTAEFARNYLHKGSRIFVEGRLRQDKWVDKESGQNRSKLAVTAERIQFAESKAASESRTHSGAGYDDEGGAPAPPQRSSAGNAPRQAPARDQGDYVREHDGGGNTEDDLPF